MLLDGNAPTQSNVLLSTADLDFPWQVGPRITLGRDFDAFRSFEATYWGIFDCQTTATVTGNNNLNLPGDLGLAAGLDFFNADTMTVEYKSQINNGELTYLQNYGGLAWLIGFRYFELGEQFSITSTDNQTGTSVYQLSAYNNLFGGQLGVRLAQACGTCTSWSYDITGKAGVYDNVISTAQRVGDFSGFSLRDVKDKRQPGGLHRRNRFQRQLRAQSQLVDPRRLPGVLGRRLGPGAQSARLHRHRRQRHDTSTKPAACSCTAPTPA